MMAFIIVIVIFILKLTSLQKRVNLLENQKNNNDSTEKELIQYEETQREIKSYCHEKATDYYMEHDMKSVSAEEAQMLISEFEETCAYTANKTLKEEK